jgi:hypothetical protein
LPSIAGGLLLVLHFGEFGIHHIRIVLLRFAATRPRGAACSASRACLLLVFGVDLLAELLRGGGERLRLDRKSVV